VIEPFVEMYHKLVIRYGLDIGDIKITVSRRMFLTMVGEMNQIQKTYIYYHDQIDKEHPFDGVCFFKIAMIGGGMLEIWKNKDEPEKLDRAADPGYSAKIFDMADFRSRDE
jgi:hypothetical protein